MMKSLKLWYSLPLRLQWLRKDRFPVSVSSQKRPLLASEEVRSRKKHFCWDDSEGSPSRN
jgi:hypothetical protein